ncbi:NAD(P)/FAD-dependent oxidoreductase [Spirochaeta africana]|uniref:Flavoprotein, HI0933 family n=1 Tax=Spirochaeta africana (strain ATCC 700263 / DSM 8902 / Z-7692) TaxID=889378 RepID=H9UJV0_SPIAZ|nr:aminoacetone oxidase family FAD-binding enzyme [Spirochaeta africana]AFG37793.1 flavoprotein, HI0933 family [Spirochaeta africana DSM 8902]
MKAPDYDVIVIGGGPAGMMAAASAAERGASVLLLEKNPEPGRKLLLSGGGRCNFTNVEPDVHRLTARYGAAGKSLISPFSKMGPREVLEFFASRGMPHKVEDNGRAFPATNKAESVLKVLLAEMRTHGVKIRTGATVDALLVNGSIPANREVHGVRLGSTRITARTVITAAGGLAYPETGSTGDGFRWMQRCGHSIVHPEPSLVPVIVHEPWIAELQGLAFPEIRIAVLAGGRVLERVTGKILFTHFGLSGPGILNLASRIADAAASNPDKPVRISLDFFPEDDGGSLDRHLQQLFAAAPKRKLKNLLDELLPPRLTARILAAAVDTGTTSITDIASITGSSVPRQLRKRLVQLMQDFRVTYKGLQSEDWAIVSRGGIPCNEIDFRTMQSKLVSGLYAVGDMLDINRPSGGYSLQICWATGFVAGCAAAAQARSR